MQIKVVSGGQSGVDRAALDAAIAVGLPISGWCPRGRRAEDGRINEVYPMLETPSEEPAQRTEWNVRDSDGTLIFCRGELTGGTALTRDIAARLGKPFCVLNPEDTTAKDKAIEFLQASNIVVLNVAGPRESGDPGIYHTAHRILIEILAEWIEN